MRIVHFKTEHVEQAMLLALDNYNEQRENVPILPCINNTPDLTSYAKNGLGVAGYVGNKMVGFLCCYNPTDKAFNLQLKGTFSPIHAHAAIKQDRSIIYKKLYQAAAHKWVEQRIASHAIAFYAHDIKSINAMFEYGFGLRCIDAIRTMDTIECGLCKGVSFDDLAAKDAVQVRQMRRLLSQHLGKSPCFMYTSSEEFEKWILTKEKSDSRLFVARDGGKIISFIETAKDGENFVTEASNMINICGAYLLPEYRGKSIFQNLLNYIIHKLQSKGYASLGVDYESYNPTANGFWQKYFSVYTNSVVRRIDESALKAI